MIGNEQPLIACDKGVTYLIDFCAANNIEMVGTLIFSLDGRSFVHSIDTEDADRANKKLY